MKKIFCISLIFFALLTATNSYAQKNTFGVKIGGNISTLGGEDVDVDIIESKVGFLLGATADYAFTDNWHLFYGLDLTQKGFKMNINDNTQKWRAMYLQLPVHAGYKMNFEPLNIIFETGPFLAYGLGGKTKSSADKLDNIKVFDKDDGIKRFDFGWNIGIGIEIREFTVSLGYDWGFVKVFEDDDSDAYSRNASLTVGYKFMCKDNKE